MADTTQDSAKAAQEGLVPLMSQKSWPCAWDILPVATKGQCGVALPSKEVLSRLLGSWTSVSSSGNNEGESMSSKSPEGMLSPTLGWAGLG